MKTLTATIIRSKKALPSVGLIAAALADIAVMCGIAVGGYNPLYYLLPSVLLALDVVFLVALFNSNLRFRYSIWVPLVTEGVKLAAVLAFFLYYYLAYGLSFIHIVVQVLWGVAHLADFLCVVLYIIGNGRLAMRRGSQAKTARRGAVFMAVVACLFVVGYVAIMLVCGLFGQGVGTYRKDNGLSLYDYQSRTPVFRLGADNRYIVVGALAGKGSEVVVPSSFNGVEITGLDCMMLLDETIDTVVLQWGVDDSMAQRVSRTLHKEATSAVHLLNYQVLTQRTTAVQICAAPAVCDSLRQQVYNTALQIDSDPALAECLVQFACQIVPIVQDGQVYHTFDYDLAGLAFLDKHRLADNALALLPTWVADEGQSFSLSTYSSTVLGEDKAWEYLRHTDADDIDDLVWNYQHNDRHIFVVSDNSGNGKATFRTIYRIGVGDGNDDVYNHYLRVNADVAAYRYSFYQDRDEQGYRYTYLLSDGFDALLSSICLREGFGVDWQYAVGAQGNRVALAVDNAADVLIDAWREGFAVYPVWHLNAPVMGGVEQVSPSLTPTYGDSFRLQADVTAPYENAKLQYTWYFDGKVVTDVPLLCIDNINPTVHTGVYRLQVVAGNDQTTSLTATATYDYAVTVGKKALHFVWNNVTDEHEVLTDLVYAGNTKTVTGRWNSADVLCENGVDADSIEVIYTDNVGQNAAIYTAKVALQGHCADLYSIAQDKGSTAQCTFEVKPYALTVQWGDIVDDHFVVVDNNQYTYDKTLHQPAAYAQVAWGEPVAQQLQVTGGIVNAGEGVADVSIANGNYVITSETATRGFCVLPKVVEIVWRQAAGYVIEYDATQHGVFADLVDGAVIAGDVVDIVYAGMAVDAGNYTMQAQLANANYAFPSHYAESLGDRLDYVIGQRPVALDWAQVRTHEYDAKAYMPAVAIGNVVGQDSVTVQVEGSQTDVGDYTATATGVSNANYCLPNQNTQCDFSITKRSLTLLADAQQKVYDGYRFDTDGYTYTVVNAVDAIDDIAQLSFADSAAWDAVNYGVYDIQLTYTPRPKAANYTITTRAGLLTIERRPVVVTPQDKNKTYDGQPFDGQYTYALSGLADTDNALDVVQSVDYYGAAIEAYNAGDYGIQASVTGGAKQNNYTYTVYSGVLHITPAQVGLDWQQERTFTYDGTAKNLTATLVGLAVRDQDSPPRIYYTAGQVDVGTYIVTATINATNYTLTEANTCNYTIERRLLEVTWDSTRTFIYDGTSHRVAATVTNLLPSDAPVYTGQQTNAGSNYSTVISVPNGNYTFADGQNSLSEAFAIQPRAITVCADDKTKEYDAQVMAESAFSASVAAETPLAAGDALNDIVILQYTNLARVGTYVGTYPIGVALAEAMAKYTNYTITYQSGTLTISQRPLVLIWQETRTFTYDGTPKSIAATVQNAVEGDNVELDYTGAATDSGTYTMQAALLVNDNYYIKSNATCNYVIRKRDLTIRADDIERTYSGTTFGDFSVTCLGLVDSLDEVVGLVFGGTATTAIDCGKGYSIMPATGEVYAKAANYNTIQYQVGSLTILPKTLAVKWLQPFTFTYDGTVKNPTATLDGVVARDLSSQPTILYSEGHSQVGNYVATASISAVNYVLDPQTVDQDYSITPRELSAKWNNQRTYTYNGKPQSVGIEVGNLVGDDQVVIDGKQTDVGDYTCSVTVPNANYTFADGQTRLTVDYTITPRVLSAKWPATENYTYTGNTVLHTPTIEGLAQQSDIDKIGYHYYRIVDGSLYNVGGNGLPVEVGDYVVYVGSRVDNYSIDNNYAYFSIVAD